MSGCRALRARAVLGRGGGCAPSRRHRADPRGPPSTSWRRCAPTSGLAIPRGEPHLSADLRGGARLKSRLFRSGRSQRAGTTACSPTRGGPVGGAGANAVIALRASRSARLKGERPGEGAREDRGPAPADGVRPRRRGDSTPRRWSRALRDAGHEAEIVRSPASGTPASELVHQMAVWRSFDITESNGLVVDAVIALKFPAYLVPTSARSCG